MQFVLNPVTFDRNHYNKSTCWLQIDREAAIIPSVVDDGDGDIRPMHGDTDGSSFGMLKAAWQGNDVAACCWDGYIAKKHYLLGGRLYRDKGWIILLSLC